MQCFDSHDHDDDTDHDTDVLMMILLMILMIVLTMVGTGTYILSKFRGGMFVYLKSVPNLNLWPERRTKAFY